MSVHSCVCGCSRKIYESSIPGGGAPVSMANAGSYAKAALQCHSCGQYVCRPCADKPPGLNPLSSCPSCGGNLAFPGVEPPGGFPLAGQIVPGVPNPMAGAVPAQARKVVAAPRVANRPATFSLWLGILGVFCCIGSIIPFAGCLGFIVDIGAITAGVLGVVKARNTGTGMGPAIVGIVLGVLNLFMTLIMTIVALANA